MSGMIINPFKAGGSDGPTGSYIEIQICYSSATFILEDTPATSHMNYYAPAVNDTRMFYLTNGGDYFCGIISSITASGTPVGSLILDGTSGSYTCLACTDDLTDSALVSDCEDPGSVYMINTDGESYSEDEIVSFDSSAHGLSDQCGKVVSVIQGVNQAGTSMSIVGGSCCECVGDCKFEVTDCATSATAIVVDSNNYMLTIGDFVAWSDGSSTYCGEVTDDNQSGTSAGYVTYQGYMDCDDCNSSEGLCLFEVTDCATSATAIVVDSNMYSPSVGDFVAWSDGSSTYCGEVTGDNQSGTSVGEVTYSGYSDCADCNSSEGL